MEQQKEQQLTATLAHIATAPRLHEKCQELLERFSIKYQPVSPANLPVDAFLEEKFVTSVHNQPLIRKIREICVVGIATQDTFLTGNTDEMTEQEFESNIDNDKYQEMAFFSIDAREHMTRTEIATLTRAFNRRMINRPVVLFVRSGQLLSLSTCERTAYVQSGHQGEKAGRVTILRDIDCSHPHRGHLDILCSLDLADCKSYDELYARWLDAFSNELLTRKFYSELSDWYAWAVQVAKFPNRLDTTDDDARFNHESCIRLITRLIFVWFLKQKKLIPDEFFDEQYIRENLIADFNPHERKTLLYDADQSKYYRLVLQNLFFAMLNRPIVAEDKTSPNNRRFRRKVTGFHLNSDYNVNNLMRYEDDFMEGGARKFLKMANTSVPFLNGGLFDCLDDKDHKLFYDGFSERRESLEQLSLPDYLFFGDEVGRSVDLSQWYDDKAKKSVSARGLIDILKRYSFTIEENTPLDQEVSLDPELLGKVFENLLASFNPETKTSARKQTGSFYTPREIVQYMVDESLVAHLKRMCGDQLEKQYRELLSYSSDDVDLNDDQRRQIMHALYNCRVLDPACGSGAFPMGMLQQMVHVLKRVDPNNEEWKRMVVDLTIKAARKELEKAAKGDEHERQKIEANREARLADIESAFNSDINDPDYARKLYLIEHCIYGVDIQPIATQISKLRFFISLVVDQKPTPDAAANFGIRPLPNLEAKFVTANTLIPLDRNRSLFTATDDIRYYEEQLHDLNHRIFLAKRNKDKKELREQMQATRQNMAQTLENLGAIGRDGFAQLTGWNMFDQNASASFFDPEWMFGVKEGFDVVIGNPPYVVLPSKNMYNGFDYRTINCCEMYALFYEKASSLLSKSGVLSFITASLFIKGIKFDSLRTFLETSTQIVKLKLAGDKVFENVQMPTVVVIAKREKGDWHFSDFIPGGKILEKMDSKSSKLSDLSNIQRGLEIGKKQVKSLGAIPVLTGSTVKKYVYTHLAYIDQDTLDAFAKDEYYFNGERLLLRETGSFLTVLYAQEKIYSNRSLYSIKIKVPQLKTKYVLACLNSKAAQYYYSSKFKSETELFPKIRIKQAKELPIPSADGNMQNIIVSLVDCILNKNAEGETANTLNEEQRIDHLVYHLYGLTYDEVLVIDPETPITREEYDNYKETK